MADWQKIRSQLVSGANAAPWGAVFDQFFIARIDSRYRNPISQLRRNRKLAGEGFSILTIQCSLIEFFEAAVQGRAYRYVHDPKLLKQWEYRASRELYVTFLTSRPPFRDSFDTTLANDFFENVRCALLHEARTRNGWIVRAKGPKNEIIDKSKKYVFRDGIQDALDEFILWYRKELAADTALQDAFIRKFDELCA